MAQVIWAEPALNDLDAIADYIALDDPEAARQPASGSDLVSDRHAMFPNLRDLTSFD
jgi:toxin ParE1/3/4